MARFWKLKTSLARWLETVYYTIHTLIKQLLLWLWPKKVFKRVVNKWVYPFTQKCDRLTCKKLHLLLFTGSNVPTDLQYLCGIRTLLIS